MGATASPSYYVTVFNELYTDFGSHSQSSPFYADVTYAALGTRVRPHWSIEVGYQYRRFAEPGGVTGRNDNSLQMYLLSTATCDIIKSEARQGQSQKGRPWTKHLEQAHPRSAPF